MHGLYASLIKLLSAFVLTLPHIFLCIPAVLCSYRTCACKRLLTVHAGSLCLNYCLSFLLSFLSRIQAMVFGNNKSRAHSLRYSVDEKLDTYAVQFLTTCVKVVSHTHRSGYHASPSTRPPRPSCAQ